MKVELRSDENPRWACCRAAIGREPEAWEFSIWIGKRWRDFSREAPPEIRDPIDRAVTVGTREWLDRAFQVNGIHEAFGTWLVAAVEAGRFGVLD